jgi:ABC-type bacteriocin/lantibiotic exporter with double-glycine peptidase domain
VIITHRREILELCSTIVIIEGGRISDVGSAEEILSGSRYFREESNGPNIM